MKALMLNIVTQKYLLKNEILKSNHIVKGYQFQFILNTFVQ